MASNNSINEWIIPCDSKEYNVESALSDLKIIDWRQTPKMKNAKAGDIVYIYCNKPAGIIAYKGAIIKASKEVSTIDDRKYWVPEREEMTPGPVMEIAVFRVYDYFEELTYEAINNSGLKKAWQGASLVSPQLSQYLHAIDKRQMSIDRFDGNIPDTCCYPFPIKIYENLDNEMPANDIVNVAKIINFQAPKGYDDLAYYFANYNGTNIDFLFEDAKTGVAEWTVDKTTGVGDSIFFMCAKTSVDHMRHVVVETRKYGNEQELSFSQNEFSLYKKYAGYIVATGNVIEEPYLEYEDGKTWRAKIAVNILDNPISIDAFRDFITISRTGSITKLNDEQYSKLLELISGKNEIEQLKEEHAKTLSLEELKKYASKNSKQVVAVTQVATPRYHRDPYIAQYAKELANGVCQLCNAQAPFTDNKGNPYLESHHIIWLSNGGSDSIDNTVALCPNCHRKMHIVKDKKDVDYLLDKKKQEGAV